MIYIFGGINLDVVAKIDGDAKINESNIANISLNAGGVGRNIARAVGNYTCAEFITCVPNDLYSNAVNELETNNISLKYSKFLHDQNSLNMYVDVVDNNGVVIGACDTKALDKFAKDDIKHIFSADRMLPSFRPGERIPIDGIIIDGESSLDTKAVTGESLPQDACVGAEALSGCINMSGVLKIRTTRNFRESTASKIIELVENASSNNSSATGRLRRKPCVLTYSSTRSLTRCKSSFS